MQLDRRRLLAGAAVGGGLLVAWQLLPRRYPDPLPATEGESGFGPWLRIAGDGTVMVAVPQLEMGQGVGTVLAQVAAMELGADWRHVALQPAPPAEVWPNGALAAQWAELWMPAFAGLAADADGWLPRRWAERHRFTATADGTALAAYEQPVREAAATARGLLAMAAAKRWDVAMEECQVTAGEVRHGKHRARFAELAESAAALRPPNPPPLLPALPAESPAAQPPGAPLRYPRLDLPGKVTGNAVFAADVRLPDMVHAGEADDQLDGARSSADGHMREGLMAEPFDVVDRRSERVRPVPRGHEPKRLGADPDGELLPPLCGGERAPRE